MSTAVVRAKAIGATAMQIFTKTANQWREPAIAEAECHAFRTALADSEIRVTNAHDSYLINLASPDPVLRVRSLVSFISELRRCEALGLTYVVSHPGNFIDDRASGIERNAEAVGIALECVPGTTGLLLEMTAGSGTAIGATFEEMARLIEAIPREQRARVGVCVDTAHVFAAGYDLTRDFDGVWRRFDDALGLARLGMMHLNDSKVALGTRRDRHELIGKGAIGVEAFRRIMTDDRFVRMAKVIETPKGNDPTRCDRRMLRLLRALEVARPIPSDDGVVRPARARRRR